MNLSDSIKAVAAAHGLTLKDIAALMPNDRAKDGTVGINYVNFSNMIKGNLTISKLESIAAVIGCNVTDFFEETPSTGSHDLTIFAEYKGRVLHTHSREEFDKFMKDADEKKDTISLALTAGNLSR